MTHGPGELVVVEFATDNLDVWTCVGRVSYNTDTNKQRTKIGTSDVLISTLIYTRVRVRVCVTFRKLQGGNVTITKDSADSLALSAEFRGRYVCVTFCSHTHAQTRVRTKQTTPIAPCRRHNGFDHPASGQ